MPPRNKRGGVNPSAAALTDMMQQRMAYEHTQGLQQAASLRERLPLLRAAAFRNFDVRIVDRRTGVESTVPFDLHKTEPGCYLNIRWKAPPASQSTPNTAFPTLPDGTPSNGVHQFYKIKYLDPASAAYELHATAVSTNYSVDDEEEEEMAFWQSRLYKGLWVYAAIAEWADDKRRPHGDMDTLCLFWSMILHFHRTGECLPKMEAWWSNDRAVAFHTATERLMKKLQDAGKNNGGHASISSDDHETCVILRFQHLTAAYGAKVGSPEYERARTVVEFVEPTDKSMIPLWWETHNALWTTTLQTFIRSGVAPCTYYLKGAGCKNHKNPATPADQCKQDHALFLPLVKKVEDLLKSSFTKQMQGGVLQAFSGQGIEVPREFRGLPDSDYLTPLQRQTKIKDLGNQYAGRQDYKTAKTMYDEALLVTASKDDSPADAAALADARAAIYSNRSLCCVNLGDFAMALADGDMCVSLKPQWFRGHFRRGFAFEKMGRHGEALTAFTEGKDVAVAAAAANPTDGALSAAATSATADCDAAAERCNAAMKLGNSKSAQKESTAAAAAATANTKNEYEGGAVSAVMFPCDPDRRPYEVAIPSNVVKYAAVIHNLLRITPAQVANFGNFLTSDAYVPRGSHEKDREAAETEGRFVIQYSPKDWAREYMAGLDSDGEEEEECEGEEGGQAEEGVGGRRRRQIPIAFLPFEVLNGKIDKTSVMILTNPQSTARPNARVCAMMTGPPKSGGLVLDLTPETASCRGDALVIRFSKAKEQRGAKASVSPQTAVAAYNAAVKANAAKTNKTNSKKKKNAYCPDNTAEALGWALHDPQPYHAWSTVNEKVSATANRVWANIIRKAMEAGTPVPSSGVAPVATIGLTPIFMNLLLRRPEEHFALDFTYEDYDKTWGIFMMFPLDAETAAEMKAEAEGEGGAPKPTAKKSSARAAAVAAAKKKIAKGSGGNSTGGASGGPAAAAEAFSPYDAVYYSCMIVPNTKEYSSHLSSAFRGVNFK